MEKKKVRVTRKNDRKDRNGVFKSGYNDWSCNLEKAEQIDADRSKWNVYYFVIFYDTLRVFFVNLKSPVSLIHQAFPHFSVLIFHRQSERCRTTNNPVAYFDMED